jgi:hypothetical protein
VQLGSILRLDETREFLMLGLEQKQYSQSLAVACGLCCAREIGCGAAMFFCCFIPVHSIGLFGSFARMGVRLTIVRDMRT